MLDFLRTKTENVPVGKKAKMIVIEGIDGTGKTTQIEMLKQYFSDKGLKLSLFDFPRYTKPEGKIIEQYLAGELSGTNSQSVSILYAVDRFAEKQNLINALSESDIILVNRYVTSNAAHQGGKIADFNDRAKFYKWLIDLEFNIFGLPRPDLTIILDLPIQASFKLIKSRAQASGQKMDNHETDQNHLTHAKQIYQEIRQVFPNCVSIDCGSGEDILPKGIILGKILDVIRRTLKI